MLRRSFLALALMLSTAPAMASEMLDYAPGLIKQALADGKTVFVDYAADWCSTCARQERVIATLREQNPQYDQAMVFVRVDWDDYRRHEVSTSRNIPRRSTLIVLRGDQELGRIVAGTGTDAIRALMDQGVGATN